MNLALLLFGPRKMHFFFLFRVLNEFENILVLKYNKIVTLFRSFGGFITKIVTFRKHIGVHKTNCVHIKTQLFTRMITHLQNVHISLWTARRQRFTGMEHNSMECSHTRRSLQQKKSPNDNRVEPWIHWPRPYIISNYQDNGSKHIKQTK